MMLSAHVVSMPILVGREGEAMLAYPKTQVTKKAVTDSKPVQLGILSGWWMKGWWKQIKLCNSICYVPGGSPGLESPLMHPEPLIPTKIPHKLAHIP